MIMPGPFEAPPNSGSNCSSPFPTLNDQLRRIKRKLVGLSRLWRARYGSWHVTNDVNYRGYTVAWLFPVVALHLPEDEENVPYFFILKRNFYLKNLEYLEFRGEEQNLNVSAENVFQETLL